MKDSAHGAGQQQGKDLGRDPAGAAELEALAARYLDLWQDQVSAMAADTDLAAAFQSLFGPSGWTAMAGASPLAAWQAMMAQFTNAAQTASAQGPGAGAADTPAKRAGDDPTRGQRHGANGTGPSAGSAAAAAASDGGGSGVDELVRRLAVLEARLAALEGGDRPAKPRRNSGKSSAKPRRKRS